MNFKTFTIHSVRNVFAFFIALGLGYVAYTVSPSSVEIPKAEAGLSDNVSGWIWSGGAGSGLSDPGEGPYTVGSNPGIGWISLNDTNEVAPYTDAPYGVKVDPMSGTGYFYGKGWSENVGWINFDQADTATCVTSYGGTRAQVNWATGDVSGWAHAYNGSPTSGWDGCIRLSGMTSEATPQPYGVKITSGKFSGYAWGGEVMGWIAFAPLINGITPLPSDDLAQIAPAACSASDPSTYTFTGSPCVATCVSGGGVTQENVPGNQYAQCFDLTVPAPVSPQACTTTLDCFNFAGSNPGTYIVGDNRCDADAGENSTNSLADCKPKTRFWQF